MTYTIKPTTIAYRQDGKVWRLTYDGRILGDSRGYTTEEEVRQAALDYIARDPDYRLKGF